MHMHAHTHTYTRGRTNMHARTYLVAQALDVDLAQPHGLRALALARHTALGVQAQHFLDLVWRPVKEEDEFSVVSDILILRSGLSKRKMQGLLPSTPGSCVCAHLMMCSVS